jgi:hypothetical protein
MSCALILTWEGHCTVLARLSLIVDKDQSESYIAGVLQNWEGYTSVWNGAAITILYKIIGFKNTMYSNKDTTKTWEALFRHVTCQSGLYKTPV